MEYIRVRSSGAPVGYLIHELLAALTLYTNDCLYAPVLMEPRLNLTLIVCQRPRPTLAVLLDTGWICQRRPDRGFHVTSVVVIT